MTRRIVIIRHGNTFEAGETPRRIGARTDLPLVASGRAQAAALVAHFANQGLAFDRILASPLLRTRETAALIAPGRTIEPVDWLREIDHGIDEGRTEAEVEARIGRAALDAWDAAGIAPAGWQVDAEARIAAWRALLSEAAGTTALVTSNGAARFALLALALPPAKLRTGAYGLIAGDPWHVAAWDRRPG